MKLKTSGDIHHFNCPGCGDEHVFSTAQGRWSMVGNEEDKPTVYPSLFVTSGHYVDGWKKEDECWCDYAAKHPLEKVTFKCYRCHSFIKNGMIEFLGDCSHDLKGQIVEIPEWTEQ